MRTRPGLLLVLALSTACPFLPKESTDKDEALPQTSESAAAVRRGSFSGADALHTVSGTVTVYRSPEGNFLRFEDYDATDGPDVTLQLSPSADGSYDEATAIHVVVPGGADDGHLTLRGNFNVPLPQGIEPDSFDSVVVWCRRFGVTFGHATLEPA